ncbi:uncharacterized protein LOC124817455 [Hydra vulgaris]|uniref:uncharacterized protein LOC124817455 n=1 Tax=Hydra vulgaris TaxID=6087 RepID=UPI0032EA6866
MSAKAKYMRKYRKVVKGANNCFECEPPVLSNSSTNAENLFALSSIANNITDNLFNSYTYRLDIDIVPPYSSSDEENCDIDDIDIDIVPPNSSSDDEHYCDIEVVGNRSFQYDLAQWVVNAKLTCLSCNGLLALLRKHGCELPKDSRTLLQTPQSYTSSGKMWWKIHLFWPYQMFTEFNKSRHLQQYTQSANKC